MPDNKIHVLLPHQTNIEISPAEDGVWMEFDLACSGLRLSEKHTRELIAGLRMALRVLRDNRAARKRLN